MSGSFKGKGFRKGIRDFIQHSVQREHTDEKSISSGMQVAVDNKVLLAKQVVINKIEMMRRIHTILKRYKAVTTDRATSKRAWPAIVENWLQGKQLIYCPEDFRLSLKDVEQLVLDNGQKSKINSIDLNWLVLIKALYTKQEKLLEQGKISMMASKQSRARVSGLVVGSSQVKRPVILVDHKKLFERLVVSGMINKKKNPCGKINLVSSSDYNIVLYYRRVISGLLSYYRCADNFYKVKNMVNWFLRYSAISTIKQKHKMASRKVVVGRFGVNLRCHNHKGEVVQLQSREEINEMSKEFLANPAIDYLDRLNKA